jgi:hypothetical protein
VRLFIFESDANTGLGLRAFAGDAAGRKLPDQLVPGGKLVRSDPRAHLLTTFPAIQSKRRSALMAFSSGASNQRRRKLHNARQTST